MGYDLTQHSTYCCLLHTNDIIDVDITKWTVLGQGLLMLSAGEVCNCYHAGRKDLLLRPEPEQLRAECPSGRDQHSLPAHLQELPS